MRFTDLRLKIRHFFRKNKKIIIVAVSIWGIIVIVNYILKNRVQTPEATTTYEPHISVMSESSSTPKRLREPIEKLIEEYVRCCNEQEYEKAFNMLSEECRSYGFSNSPANFVSHVLARIPNKREYSIQDYSNFTANNKKIYIYEVKFTEDMLATGLTGTQYAYTSEKMAFYEDDEGNIKMSVGSYIYQTSIQSISENEYLKIDIMSKIVTYDEEIYKVKFTNRSEHTVVVADGYGAAETELQLPNETRKRVEDAKIVLEPGSDMIQTFTFQKFADDGDDSQSIIFGSIRVMEHYSGTEDVEEEIIQSEIDNAIAKFSLTVSVKE